MNIRWMYVNCDMIREETLGNWKKAFEIAVNRCIPNAELFSYYFWVFLDSWLTRRLKYKSFFFWQ